MTATTKYFQKARLGHGSAIQDIASGRECRHMAGLAICITLANSLVWLAVLLAFGLGFLTVAIVLSIIVPLTLASIQLFAGTDMPSGS